MSYDSNSPPNLLDVDNNSFLPYKPKSPNDPYNKYTNYILILLSFFSSLLLIFSIFIISKYHFTFSSLFHSTIFWFLISNTLIFIIAADYVFFSLPQQKSFNFYEDYSPPNPKQTHFQLQSSSLVVFDEERENPDENLKTVVQGHDFPPRPPPPRARTYERRKLPKRSKLSKESKKMMGKKSESSVVKYEGKKEINEFTKMTDEELNTRVEEFIQRFNTQMRLQTRSTDQLNSLDFRD